MNHLPLGTVEDALDDVGMIDTLGAEITSRDNCNAGGNYKKTGAPKHFDFASWRISNDEWGQKLCVADPGKEPQCYYLK